MGNWTARERVEQRKIDPSFSYVLRTGNEAEEPVQEIPLVHSQPVHTLCPADSTHLVTGSDNRSVLVYQWTCHTIKQNFKLPSKSATQIVYNSNNHVIYAASRDSGIYGWRWPTAEPAEGSDHVTATMTDHTLPVTGIATIKDLMVSGSRDNSVKFWDLRSQSCISSVHIPRNLVTDIKWIGEEHCVLQSSEDKTLRVWDTRTCSVVQQLPPKQHIQLCCNVSECGTYFISGSSGQSGGVSGSEVTLWDKRKFSTNTTNGSCTASTHVSEYLGHTSAVNSCMFLSPGNANMLVSCSNDSTIRVWNRDKGGASLLSEYVSGAGPVSDLASPTSSLIACSTFHKGVYVWSVQKSQSEDYQLYLRAKY